MSEENKSTIEQKPEQKRDVVIHQSDIAIKEDGSIQASTLTELYRVSNMLCKSGILPKAYDTPEKVMTAVTLARELGLKPLSALKNIAVINGSPSIWGELPLGIIRNSGLLVSINEFCIDKDYKPICFENKNIDSEIFAAVCIIKRKNEEERSFYYSALDASKNPNKGNQVWISYRSIMMKRRARSIALKDVFGDLLGGISIAEYDHDIIPTEARNYVTTTANTRPNYSAKTEEINQKLQLSGKDLPPPVYQEEAGNGGPGTIQHQR